jgi:hypothetical protein
VTSLPVEEHGELGDECTVARPRIDRKVLIVDVNAIIVSTYYKVSNVGRMGLTCDWVTK